MENTEIRKTKQFKFYHHSNETILTLFLKISQLNVNKR